VKVKILLIIICMGVFSLIVNCRNMFTNNLFSSFQRDPENLSDGQKISYAKDILAVGSTAQIRNAYNLINNMLIHDSNNTELLLLAADLAIGGSGVLEVLDEVKDESSLEAALALLDLNLIQASADHIQTAEALGAEISVSQYLNTGVILLGVASDQVGGFSNLNLLHGSIPAVVPPDPVAWETLLQADNYITQGGGDISDYGVENSNLP